MEAAGTRPALGFRRCCVCACEPRGAARRPPWVFQERRGCAGGVWLRSMLSAHMLLQTQLHCCVLARRCGDREGARRRMPRHSAAGFRQRRAGSAVDRSVRASDGMGGGEQPEGSLSGGEGGADGAIAYDSGEFEARNVTMRLPRDVVKKMRDTVFGFEFFVTGVEDYQANGVLFKGNLRGDPARAHRHISERLQARPV